MHKGYLPYVDIWDRKPWGLFFLYYLIAFCSYTPLAYQLVATLFVTATAWVIGRLATLGRAVPKAGLYCGIVYLLWLDRLQGFGGQTPVFYNLFMATAALLVFRARTILRAGRAPWSVAAAMLLAGCAITIKTTAVFESLFLGITCAVWFMQAPVSRDRKGATIAALALAGAAPSLAITAWYALHGYWQIYWQAMVLSNLAKPTNTDSSAIRAVIDFIIVAPILIVAALSLPDWKGPLFHFVRWWLLAAFIGLCSVPNFFMHYALPILVPLCVLPERLFERRIVGPVALALLAAWSLQNTHAFDFERTQKTRQSLAALVRAIRTHDNGHGLFVVDSASQLYMLTDQPIPTPLIFPSHLGLAFEKDVSHLSTMGEVRRVLRTSPGTVVIPHQPIDGPPNMEVFRAVRRYVHTHCRRVASVRLYEIMNVIPTDVWAQCHPGKLHRE
ncbi:hypothetical protein MTR62_08335 [Novosphingobium sp. 1949]|uniref:Glycosyltransferase RgtA/B/C/D-like domain-containing protein n=1 Tax=Novosphingobium organovorum TaxID=2930092 RepID=A0ABT0BCB6_9SPHN|nr:hypothetical protein [Novosphingobium organovorum]MCJ2182696.1 hypothetical protein [Novosphingobium organovorum]